MARIKTVKKARASKKPRRCTICQHEVQLGESYKFIEKKTGPRTSLTLTFCDGCNPRPSHLLSGRAAEYQRILEDYQYATKETNEEMKDALDDLANNIADFASELDESGQAIEDGFGHATSQSEAMRDTATTMKEWAEKLSEHAEAYPLDWYSEAESLSGEEPDLELGL